MDQQIMGCGSGIVESHNLGKLRWEEENLNDLNVHKSIQQATGNDSLPTDGKYSIITSTVTQASGDFRGAVGHVASGA